MRLVPREQQARLLDPPELLVPLEQQVLLAQQAQRALQEQLAKLVQQEARDQRVLLVLLLLSQAPQEIQVQRAQQVLQVR